MGDEEDHSFCHLAEEIRKDIHELNLSELIDKEIVRSLQESLVRTTGLVFGIFDNDFHSIIPNSPRTEFCTVVDNAAHQRCLEEDMNALRLAKKEGEPILQECFACDTLFFAAPIIIQGEVMGSILGGQVRTEPPDDEKLVKFAREIGADEKRLIRAAHSMRIYSEPDLKSWAKLLQSIVYLVAEIGHERMVTKQLGSSAEERMKKRDGELHTTETMYKNLFEQSNDAVFIHTVDGRMVDVNTRAEELLGYTKDELMEMRVPELHTEDTIDQSYEAFGRIKKERSIRFETEMRRKDGSVVPVEISSRFFKTNGDEFIQGIVRDISDRARFISLLRRARDVLREKVAEKTAALEASKRQLEKKVRDLEHWEDLLFEREMTISRLEEEVNRLRQMLARRSKANSER